MTYLPKFLIEVANRLEELTVRVDPSILRMATTLDELKDAFRQSDSDRFLVETLRKEAESNSLRNYSRAMTVDMLLRDSRLNIPKKKPRQRKRKVKIPAEEATA